MIYVIVLVLLLLAAFFILMRYERFAHRDPKTRSEMEVRDEKGELVRDEEGGIVTVPIRHGALDESLFTGIKLGLAEDWRRLRKRGRP